MDAEKTGRQEALSEKLTDVVLYEADPDNWPGAARPPRQHSQQERGDRYWCKKNAAATLTLLVKVHRLIGQQQRGKSGAGDDDEKFELGQQIASAEREAKKILERLQNEKK